MESHSWPFIPWCIYFWMTGNGYHLKMGPPWKNFCLFSKGKPLLDRGMLHHVKLTEMKPVCQEPYRALNNSLSLAQDMRFRKSWLLFPFHGVKKDLSASSIARGASKQSIPGKDDSSAPWASAELKFKTFVAEDGPLPQENQNGEKQFGNVCNDTTTCCDVTIKSLLNQ